MKTPEDNQLQTFGGYFVESETVQNAGQFAEHIHNSKVEKSQFFDVSEGFKQDL